MPTCESLLFPNVRPFYFVAVAVGPPISTSQVLILIYHSIILSFHPSIICIHSLFYIVSSRQMLFFVFAIGTFLQFASFPITSSILNDISASISGRVFCAMNREKHGKKNTIKTIKFWCSLFFSLSFFENWQFKSKKMSHELAWGKDIFPEQQIYPKSWCFWLLKA
jgi:hypothetical protein